MNKKKHRNRVAIIRPYILEMAQKMNLGHWEIEVGDKPCRKDAWGTAMLTNGKWHVFIQLDKGFHKRSPEDLRLTICHELVHPHLAPLHIPLSEGLGPVAKEYVLNELEYSVNELSKIIAPFMPLPPKLT